MPTKAKKNKKNAKKTAKPQNKKVVVKAKKKGKTVTFQAKPKTDPLGKVAHKPNDPCSNDPRVCQCGNLDCSTTHSLHPQPQQIPDFIRQLAEQLGNNMGAAGVVVVGIPLNPANPRNTAPTQEELVGLLQQLGLRG